MPPKPLAWCAALALWATACVEEGPFVRIEPEQVLYDGEPYGDFLVLADAVRSCMNRVDETLPRIVLVHDLFECHTTEGWREVYGCSGAQDVYMVASVVVDTAGMLWAHELTHYFGADHENDRCGRLAIRDFSIDPVDGGT